VRNYKALLPITEVYESHYWVGPRISSQMSSWTINCSCDICYASTFRHNYQIFFILLFPGSRVAGIKTFFFSLPRDTTVIRHAPLGHYCASVKMHATATIHKSPEIILSLWHFKGTVCPRSLLCIGLIQFILWSSGFFSQGVYILSIVKTYRYSWTNRGAVWRNHNIPPPPVRIPVA
jgi:hypothetical protein